MIATAINNSNVQLESNKNEEKCDRISQPDIDNIQENDENKNNEQPKLGAIEGEQAEIKKEKEAKLKSYKQFIAEQFSHKKIDYSKVRVTIEAMLVAMMLGPITGVALATIDYRMPLLHKSLFTAAAAGFLVIFVGFVVGWLHQGQPLTVEVLSRTQPISIDLMIALAGGTAGINQHYCHSIYQCSGTRMLWFLGFRRLVDGDYKSGTYLTFLRRNAVTLLLLVGLGIYLTINLNNNVRQQTFENHVKKTINSYFMDKGNVLTNTQFENVGGYQTIRAVIHAETSPDAYDVQQIETIIMQNMGDYFPTYLPVKLQLRYMPVLVIESNSLIQNKLDKTDAAILTN